MAKDTGTINIQVNMGHVSSTKDGASIGISIDQDELPFEKAKDNLIKCRVRCTLKVVADDGVTGSLITEPFNGVADFHKASFDQETMSGRLCFNCDEETRKRLMDFDGHKAQMIFNREGVAGETNEEE